MVHRILVAPSAFALAPACWPASRSSEEKWASAPASWKKSVPELKLSTGMPAAIAFFTVGIRASGVTRVVAIPSTFESIAFWISTACLLASGSAEYFNVDPVSLAACSAPARIRSQNVSPGVSWVIMAKV